MKGSCDANGRLRAERAGWTKFKGAVQQAWEAVLFPPKKEPQAQAKNKGRGRTSRISKGWIAQFSQATCGTINSHKHTLLSSDGKPGISRGRMERMKKDATTRRESESERERDGDRDGKEKGGVREETRRVKKAARAMMVKSVRGMDGVGRIGRERGLRAALRRG